MSLLSTYIATRLQSISHPYDPERRIQLPHLPLIAATIEAFLQLPANTLIGGQIEAAVRRHQSTPIGEPSEHFSALRDLIHTVEPFLKAIGKAKHQDDPEQMKRVDASMLGALLEQGIVLPKAHWDTGSSNRHHSDVYWRNQELLTATSYLVYRLRNELAHELPQYSIDEILSLFRATVSFFVLVVSHEDNFPVLQSISLPYLGYLQELSRRFTSDNGTYYPLVAGLVWQPEAEEIGLLDTYLREDLIDRYPSDPTHVYDLVGIVGSFVLLGDGGTGKSRTLRHLLVRLAYEQLSAPNQKQKIPVLLSATVLRLESGIRSALLAVFRHLSPSIIDESLRSGDFLIMIDGINEVALQNYGAIVQEMLMFLHHYDSCNLVVSTRGELYHNVLPLPVYSLLALEREGVLRILQTYSKSESAGTTAFHRLSIDERLISVFSSPLMAKLLCDVPADIPIPRSLGQLMKIVLDQVLAREDRKGERVSKSIRILVLSALAQYIRGRGTTVALEPQVLAVLAEVLKQYANDVSTAGLLANLIGSGILDRHDDEYIGFFHEMALDYFFAISLRDDWTLGPARDVLERIAVVPSTALEILGGLLDSPDAFIRVIMDRDLALAARCYAARRAPATSSGKAILSAARDHLLSGKSSDQVMAVRSLVEMNDLDATGMLFGALPTMETDAVDAAVHAMARQLPAGIGEHLRRALRGGNYAQRLVALKVVASQQLAEYTQDIVAIADDGATGLAGVVAKTLGRLASAQALAYLQEQLGRPASMRTIPMDVAISALASRESVDVIRRALRDTEAGVRQAAVGRIDALTIDEAVDDVLQIFETEHDFAVCLLALIFSIRTGRCADLGIAILHLFSNTPTEDEIVPVTPLLRLIQLLPRSALDEIVLQAITCRNRAIQSILIRKSLEKDVTLALDLLGLIDMADMSITPGVKADIIGHALQSGVLSTDAVISLVSTAGDPHIRRTILANLNHVPTEMQEQVLTDWISDPSEQVRLSVVRAVRSLGHDLNWSLLQVLLTDDSTAVRREGFRYLNAATPSDDQHFILLTEKEWPLDVRRRAFQALCSRRFLWPLDRILELARDQDRVLRHQALGVLKAISRDGPPHIGYIQHWNEERAFGFVRQLETDQEWFFHLSGLVDKSYLPGRGHLVAFRVVGQLDANTRPRAVEVRFLAEVGSIPYGRQASRQSAHTFP